MFPYMLSLFLKGKNRGPRSTLLVLNCVTFGGRVIWEGPTIPFDANVSGYVAPLVYWNFSAGLPQRFFCLWVTKTAFSRASQTMAWRRFLGHFQVPAGTEVCMAITRWRGGQDATQPLGGWCWIPQILKWTFVHGRMPDRCCSGGIP